VVACATSYNAIYRLVGQLGLYGYRINQAFPLLLDAAFLVAELAAILGGIMRAVTRSDEVSAGWPGAAMLLCGLGTIGFNVGHAYLLGGRGDPLTVWRCVVASLPPVLMMVSFQVLIAIVKWVMLHLGRPLHSAAALTPTMPVPGYGMVPPVGPYGWFPPHPVYGQVPSAGQQGAGQNGHGELPEPTKRAAVELHLSRLTLRRLGWPPAARWWLPWPSRGSRSRRPTPAASWASGASPTPPPPAPASGGVAGGDQRAAGVLDRP